MSKTPICDFLDNYNNAKVVRMHMPGHKGNGDIEKYDITEINGADYLYNSCGIIKKSEEIAGEIFDTRSTFYATGGSSQALKAMICLAMQNSDTDNNIILCARASHQAFFIACALLDLMPQFIDTADNNTSYSCKINAKTLDDLLHTSTKKPFAVFVTSPNYLGEMQNIKELSAICKKYSLPLLVDNAHGAYLRFVGMHPINLGADMCCDSAHKTLPALTGAAYLHISKTAQKNYEKNAKKALLMFGSTSPSYLILRSLDNCNKLLCENHDIVIKNFIDKLEKLKKILINKKFNILKTEPLKLVINANSIGYKGYQIADILRKNNIEAEFYDDEYIVFMLSSFNSDEDLNTLKSALINIKHKSEIKQDTDNFMQKTKFALSPRQALLSKTKTINVNNSYNCVCANVCVFCPPAIPIVVSGEIINKDIIRQLKKHNINEIDVVDL